MAAEPDGELRVAVKGARGGALYAGDLQRGRLLSATFALVGERGYEGVSARSVAERAGMSNRTFYEFFSDREDCFLAAFNHGVDGLEREMRGGWESQLGWTARVRAALAALLRALDREPVVRRLVFVEALAAGPRVLARRARVLEGLAGVVDLGRENASAPERLPGLVAEGVVGATFGVIHARVLELRPDPLIGLLGSLMATIVLPYRGSAAAVKEFDDSVPRLGQRGGSRSRLKEGPSRPVWRADRRAMESPIAQHVSDRDRGPVVRDRLAPLVDVLDYRLTVRTQMALAAVGGRPGLNNREVSEIIGLADQGQISRMMKRLQVQGLVENAQGHSTRRRARAWRLTADGEAVIDAHKPLKQAQRTAGRGGRLATRSSRKDATFTHVSLGSPERVPGDLQNRPRRLRMTARTREVLTRIADLSGAGHNPSNRQVAQAAGVKDEGQISKLLARLEGEGLLKNKSEHPTAGNAWQITKLGAELLAADGLSRTGAAR